MTTLREAVPSADVRGWILTVDAEGGLDVWARPGVYDAPIGSVSQGLAVTVDAETKHWVRLTAPVEGWAPAALLV